MSQELSDFVTSQRWFGSKTRAVTQADVIDRASLVENLELLIVEVRFDTGTHETYQLISDGSLDVLTEPQPVRDLVSLMRRGVKVPADDGVVEFGSGYGFGAELREARPVESEQSNTSIVFDEELILKVFRRLEPGINPELELLRFLMEHEFENIAKLAGWYSYTGRQMDATLGILQEFVSGGVDGWERALDTMSNSPDDFVDSLHRLGEVIGNMHTMLGSDATDPNFCPEETSGESLGLLTATVDEEIESIFVDLPEDAAEVDPIRGRGEEVRERLRLLTNIGGTGRVIRHHGDLHLGQTLWADRDWVILDFEGEPARSLRERRRKRSPLRDVAGMLRSFAYAASAAPSMRGVDPPEGWEADARIAFLDGYRETIDKSLVPSGTQMDKLLQVFELEKAVYELRYELNNRPDWVSIPVAGIVRMLEEEVPV